MFSYLKQVLFEVSEKRLEMNAWKKKSLNAFVNFEKKVFLKLVESLSDIHMTHTNTTIHFLMIQFGRFISDKSNHLIIKLTVIYIPRFAPSSGSDMKKYPAFPAVRNASRGLEVLCGMKIGA